jgi:predicted TIM-barrel fold metal-dependent hydrolase
MAADAEFVEEILDPQLPIIDAHHHLWGPGFPVAPSVYLLDQLSQDLASGHLVEATVFVEARSRYRTSGPEELRPVGETEFANATAEEAGRRKLDTRVAAGIVAYADLMLGDDVDAVLDAHEAVAPHRLRGIRHIAAPTFPDVGTDPGLLRQPRFQAGLSRVGARGLSFDLYVFQTQLADAVTTVRMFPDVSFVLNHLGGLIGVGPLAGRQESLRPQWRQDIAALGREPNVAVKLGGAGMFLTGFRWHKQSRLPSSVALAAATEEYFHHAIESFGPDRCMFESNFPPDKISGSYRTLWNSFKIIASSYTTAEKQDMFSGTARRWYRL